ncbi:MAG: helix-turn-helix transcriptional regulator [Phycisphaerae bacterium]|nr:helix-turn-helix transcriptional regulator [Phycisphaerae bacterium]
MQQCVLKTAIRNFAEYGYNNTMIVQIAANISANKQYIYQLFRNKKMRFV